MSFSLSAAGRLDPTPRLELLLIPVNQSRAESFAWGRVMPLYVVSYGDPSSGDSSEYQQLMFKWQARQLLRSVWLVELAGPAEAVRSIVTAALGGGAAVAVIEITGNSDWAASHAFDDGIEWLTARSGS